MRLFSSLLFLITFAPSIVFAQSAAADIGRHGFTETENAIMTEHNERLAQFQLLRDLLAPETPHKAASELARLPFAEYHETGYVIFSDGAQYNSGPEKLKIAKNLPANVKLVVYTQNDDEKAQRAIADRYAQVISRDRLRVVYVPSRGIGFWARDGVPVPVWSYDNLGAARFTVVDARYYHRFEPDQEFSQWFFADLVKHDYFFEGGNFVANSRGECIVVDNSRVMKIPDSIFNQKYGCQSVLRLPHIKGIGHIDESVKFIDDTTVITDDEGYRQELLKKGYTVVKMPRPKNQYETYVNSLIVNGVAFVPTFNQAKDLQAIRIYESFGLKVVPMDSIALSNDGLGSIHCITMAYPPVPMQTVIESLGAESTTP